MRLLDRIAAPLLARELAFPEVDFTAPKGEPAIVPPDSMSWRVFSNPVALYVGGVAAVLLELGEPRVRTGVWQFSSFREQPRERMRRTGLGAMITVFGARSQFEAYAAYVNGLHAEVAGTTEAGRHFRASDPELLLWVQATAAFAFSEAYCRFVHPLGDAERDLFYAEAAIGARLYGVAEPPGSAAALAGLFARFGEALEPSRALGEFLHIMRTAPLLPGPLRPLQRLITRAAIDLLPGELRARIGLAGERGLGRAERALLRAAARAVAGVHVAQAPWAQACRRLGLPADYLSRPAARPASSARLRS
ncbi:MAG TPA: oxygenase MpaB family protein [Sphingomicrobium sp.]|nr:oxygenase MpaB family protein [Sphingomicrobium sp.]